MPQQRWSRLAANIARSCLVQPRKWVFFCDNTNLGLAKNSITQDAKTTSDKSNTPSAVNLDKSQINSTFRTHECLLSWKNLFHHERGDVMSLRKKPSIIPGSLSFFFKSSLCWLRTEPSPANQMCSLVNLLLPGGQIGSTAYRWRPAGHSTSNYWKQRMEGNVSKWNPYISITLCSKIMWISIEISETNQWKNVTIITVEDKMCWSISKNCFCTIFPRTTGSVWWNIC